jgi:hypothetical protein
VLDDLCCHVVVFGSVAVEIKVWKHLLTLFSMCHEFLSGTVVPDGTSIDPVVDNETLLLKFRVSLLLVRRALSKVLKRGIGVCSGYAFDTPLLPTFPPLPTTDNRPNTRKRGNAKYQRVSIRFPPCK